MDIRKATMKATDTKGTVPPSAVTEEAGVPRIPASDAEDGIMLAPDKDTPEDMVISSYLEFLEKNGITRDDIKEVLQAIITSGNVRWSFDLFGSIPVVFQIRPSWVNDYIIECIDNTTSDNDKVSMVRYNNLIAVCNLAASLVQYGKDTYEIKTHEDFDAAKERVQNMPYVVQNALVNKLAVFDRTIAVATSDWAVKNFTEPRKEK